MAERSNAARRRLGVVFRVVCVVATGIALWWFLRGLDGRKLRDVLAGAEVWLLVVAVLLNFVSQSVKGAGWFTMLNPRYRVPLPRLVRYEFVAQAVSSITPARAGEALRFWLFKREGVSPTAATALIGLKKLFGGTGLAILVFPTLWLLDLPGEIVTFVVLFAAAMILLLVLLCLAARGADNHRLPRVLRGLAGGLFVLRDPTRTVATLGVVLLGEAVDLAAAVVVLYALHIDVSLIAASLVLFLIDFANMIPVAPAQLGTFEVGAFYGLDLLHVPVHAAVAFALVFHAQQVLPQIVVGLPLHLRILFDRRRDRSNAPTAAR